MREWKKNKQKQKDVHNNRINIILAIVFLLGGALLYKLFVLQIYNYDLYNAMAQNQHQVSTQLEPERGEIFIKSGRQEDPIGAGMEKDLYPLATNKDYALVYAIPKEIESRWDARKIAEGLYEIFDKEDVRKKVEEHFKDEDEQALKADLNTIDPDLDEEQKKTREREIKSHHEARKRDQDWQEKRDADIRHRIEEKKEEKVDDYMETLTKENDPYEPLHKKVEKDTLKRLYANLLSEDTKNIAPNDLVLKNGQAFVKKGIASEDSDTQGEQLKHMEVKGLSYLIKSYRYYPENEVTAHTLGFVSHNNGEKQGNYGLEGFFEKELSGEHGSITYGKGATRDTVIINDRKYKKPRDGSDLVLTLDRGLQFYACQKIKGAVEKYAADGGSVIAVDPETGKIMAMCSHPSFNPNNYGEAEDMKVYNNPIIFEQYEPGSIFKTITMAAALDEGAVTPKTQYKDMGKIMIKGWDKPIKNSDYDTHGPHGVVTMNYVLEQSLNTGSIYAMKQVGANTFADYVEKFGFGQRTGIELKSEAKGNIENLKRDNVPQIYGATASYGQGISVTPLQMVMSYAAIANNGVLMKPFVVEKIIHPDGGEDITRPVQRRKVISDKAATLLSGMLVNVIRGGHAELAGVDGYYVGGKTGTAQVASSETRGYGSKTIHSFIGFAPIDDPRFVMLVKLDNPRNATYSASSAAPVFGDIAEFIFDYYQIPKDN